MAGQLASIAWRSDIDVDRVLRTVALEMRCEVGKARLGLGFNSLGESLVRYVDADRFCDLRVWLSDKANVLTPPYSSKEQMTEIAERRTFAERGIWGWPREEARRYYEASGGDPSRFDAEYDFGLATNREILAAIDRGEFTVSSCGPMIVIAATRR
jgi:hypothetical protein